MKKYTHILTLLLSLTAAAMSTASVAADNNGAFFGKPAKGKWIIGGKAAKIDANETDINDADAYGVVLGYEFDTRIGDLGGTSTFELEYIKGDEAGFQNQPIEFEADILNLFFTYRSAGDFYYKVKGGLSYADITVRSLAFDSQQSEEISVAGGIGLGYRIGELGSVELEYSKDTGDSELAVLGINALLQF